MESKPIDNADSGDRASDLASLNGALSGKESPRGDARLQSTGPNLGSTGVIVSFAAQEVRRN
jgi:hypothetical protein